MLTHMPTPRYALGAGAINGNVYAVGGEYPLNNYLTTNEAYDPTSNTWQTMAPMQTPRRGLGVGVVNGILYAVGGYPTGGTVEAYDPTTNAWTYKASMPLVNGVEQVEGDVGGDNGILYVLTPSNPGTRTLEAYNPVTNSWTLTDTTLPAGGRDGVAVVGGTLYSVGGIDTNGHVVGTVYAFDLANHTWTAKAPMLTPRQQLSVDVVNGILYALGGDTETQNATNVVESYDPRTDTWRTEPSMPTGRDSLATGVVNGVFYAVGGAAPNLQPIYDRNEAFTPTTLTATGTSFSPKVGHRFARVVASFTDSANPGAATDYSAVVDWGDGSPLSTGGISDNVGGNYDVAASHRYNAPGTFTLTITITDNRETTRTAMAYSTANVRPGHHPSMAFILTPTARETETPCTLLMVLGNSDVDRGAQATNGTGSIDTAALTVSAPVLATPDDWPSAFHWQSSVGSSSTAELFDAALVDQLAVDWQV
jgi:hypothetical protein